MKFLDELIDDESQIASFCISVDFHQAVAHGIDSHTLQGLQYFFDASATEDNSIPIVNFNLSSPDLVLPSVPDLKLNNSFITPSMNSIDDTQRLSVVFGKTGIPVLYLGWGELWGLILRLQGAAQCLGSQVGVFGT